MKRTALFLVSVLIISSLFSFGVSAATKQDVVDAAKTTIPTGYDYLFLIQLENIFAQLDVSEEKCDRIIEIINELGQSVEDSGHTLHLYAKDNRDIILKYFDEICDICGLTYEYKIAVKDPLWHEGDVVCLVYDSEGNLLGMLDGDQDILTKKTDVSVTAPVPLILPVCAAGIIAAAALVFMKNRKVSVF
jgi:hypothetical protein